MGIADYIKNRLPYWPAWLNLMLLRLNVLGPWVYGRTYMRLRNTIDRDNPEELLLAMANHALRNVPYYRRRYPGMTIGSVEEFEQKIAPIDKAEVMAHWDEFVADGTDPGACVTGTTGGTSGKPLKLMMPRNRYAREMVFWHRNLRRFGWNYDTRAVIRNHHLPQGRDYIVNPVMKEFIFDPFRMNADYARTVWHTMRLFRIRFVHAYPSAAYQFLKLCRRQGLDVSFVKACFLASEPVTAEQRQFIEQELGIAVFSFFGHSEKLIFAGNRPGETAYCVEESYGYLELLDKEGRTIGQPGQWGEMVGTTFFNFCFPLLRYRTGDYSAYAPGSTDRPRRLETVEGRWENSLIYKADGTTTSCTAMNLHGEVYEHIDGLQYVQEEKGRLKVLVIPNAEYTGADERQLQEHIGAAMGGSRYVEICTVERLIFQPNGKFLPLISRVNGGK